MHMPVSDCATGLAVASNQMGRRPVLARYLQPNSAVTSV